jgi:hypothetical protein
MICRRFGRLRARLLLLKQDRLSMLERQLDEVDQAEPAPLFLGMSRLDRNEERRNIISQLEASLTNYGERPIACLMAGMQPAQAQGLLSFGFVRQIHRGHEPHAELEGCAAAGH